MMIKLRFYRNKFLKSTLTINAFKNIYCSCASTILDEIQYRPEVMRIEYFIFKKKANDLIVQAW